MHYDHIQIITRTERLFRTCSICRAEEEIILPQTDDDLMNRSASFITAHRDCPMRTATHD